MTDYLGSYWVTTDELDYFQFDVSDLGGKAFGAPLAIPMNGLWKPLRQNILPEKSAVILFAPSRGDMKTMIRQWEEKAKGQGWKDWIAVKPSEQLGIISGRYGSRGPTMGPTMTYVTGTVYTKLHNAKETVGSGLRRKIAEWKFNKNTTVDNFNKLKDIQPQIGSYSKKDSIVDSLMRQAQSGGYYCYVGSPGPRSGLATVLHQKAIKLSELCAYLTDG